MIEHSIDLNAATAEALTRVPGIGPVLARRLVSYRDEVGPFVELSQITRVSGIGENTYRSIAEHLSVVALEEALESTGREPSPEPAGWETAAEASIVGVSDPGSLAVLEEESWSELEALPVGAQTDEEELTVPEEALEEEPALQPLQTDQGLGAAEEEALRGPAGGLEEAWKETAPEPDDWPEETGEKDVEAEPILAEPDAAADVEEEGLAAEVEVQPAVERREEMVAPSVTRLPPTSAATRPQQAPSRSWWRRLSWLWTALLGGLLGLAFALVVLSAINGSLDVGHSRAVLDVKARMESLTTDIGSLEGDVDGLRARLDAMEELAVRMDQSEAAVSDLQEATAGLGEQADALQARVVALVAEVESISEEVERVKDQAEETRGFFQALRTLLNDFLGESEGTP
jgi:competence ComEA-like helix-hairpin-helix protein